MNNEVPELRIYSDSVRTDLPIVMLVEGSSQTVVWLPKVIISVASIMLNEAATRRGVHISHLQQANIIKFEGHAYGVKVYILRPGEQLLVGLFFGSPN